MSGCSGEERETEVESVIDAFYKALEATDPEAAAAMFASDGVLVDTNHYEWIGRSEIARFVERYGLEITRCERTGPVEATSDDTFVVPIEFDWRGTEHQREAVFTVEDGLIVRVDWVPIR
jgi:uncharacterized protein (TIGR02246 family)